MSDEPIFWYTTGHGMPTDGQRVVFSLKSSPDDYYRGRFYDRVPFPFEAHGTQGSAYSISDIEVWRPWAVSGLAT